MTKTMLAAGALLAAMAAGGAAAECDYLALLKTPRTIAEADELYAANWACFEDDPGDFAELTPKQLRLHLELAEEMEDQVRAQARICDAARAAGMDAQVALARCGDDQLAGDAAAVEARRAAILEHLD